MIVELDLEISFILLRAKNEGRQYEDMAIGQDQDQGQDHWSYRAYKQMLWLPWPGN